jgi:hypothetical protein
MNNNLNKILKPKTLDDVKNQLYIDSKNLSCFNFCLNYEKYQKELKYYYSINILKLNIKLKYKIYYLLVTYLSLNSKFFYFIYYPVFLFYFVTKLINSINHSNYFIFFTNIFIFIGSLTIILFVFNSYYHNKKIMKKFPKIF